MPFLVNERKLVEEASFQFENRIKSPASRFIDTTPVFVTYYHLAMDESTVDEGFLDINNTVGNKSPLRFNKIENFPLYGVNQIVLNLQDDDQGLDSSYEDDAIVLPNTIRPLTNDYFTIPTLKDSYVFKVTNIQYDSIMPDNYYKIEFKLEYIDTVKANELDNQAVKNFNCILENIGTENTCIIENSSYDTIKKIEKMYHNIAEFYSGMFYSEKHNVFLGMTEEGRYYYDPYQTEFVNKHRLFTERNSLTSLILTDQVEDPKRAIKYARSIYRYFELRDMRLLSNFTYLVRSGMTEIESSFYRWHDTTVDIIDYCPRKVGARELLPEEFKVAIKTNCPVDTTYADFIKRYLRSETITINDIPLTLDDDLMYLNRDLEIFFYTPLIMYIIRNIVNDEMKDKTKHI